MMPQETLLQEQFSSLYDLIEKTFGASSMTTSEFKEGLLHFYKSYENAIRKRGTYEPLSDQEFESSLKALKEYIPLIHDSIERPTAFGHYHSLERTPYDFYQFGLDMVFPLIERRSSSVLGIQDLKKIDEALQRKENVILLSNHQAEIDPQIISLLIEKHSPYIAENIICVAGHRVTSDPLAIPFSRGRNLICIYSKKYIEHPPELKAEKLSHNARAMGKLDELLNQGGVCLYIAPSGGRDRYLPGTLECEPAAFDPQSVEMFRLLSKKAQRPTHLHLLALHSIDILPPPSGINIQLGEERVAYFNPAGLFFGPQINPDELEGLGKEISDKQERRKFRADSLTHEVRSMYRELRKSIDLKSAE